MRMTIGVFCSQYDVASKYTDVAKEFGRLIASHRHTLVWGGADGGLMGIIAETAQKGGARIIGVIREAIQAYAKKESDEMHIVPNVHEMNLGIINRADVVCALVGGIGTLNELTEVIRMNKNKQHAKSVIFINTDGFYTGLREQLRRMSEEGFIREDVTQSVYFADTPEDAMRYIEQYGH